MTRIKRNNNLFDKKQKTQKEWEDLYRNVESWFTERAYQ